MNLTIISGAEKKELQVNNVSKKSLLDILNENGINIESDCGGIGKCDKCKVKVLELSREYRACELKICNLSELINEAYNKESLTTDSLTIEILRGNSYDMEIVNALYNEDDDTSSVSTKGNIKESSSLNKNTKDKALAIDIGTTTIAFALLDVRGEVIDTLGMTNSQGQYGTDVISRIKAASSGKKDILRKCIIENLTQGIKEMCTNNGTFIAGLNNIAITGNTTMCHILMGYDCTSLGIYPYTPVNINTIVTDTEKLLGINESIPVIIPPGFTTFVGADITSGVFALTKNNQETFLLIDLGTNGEMVLVNKGKILVTSTAAGPAFEGGNISCGVASISGAISHVAITNNGMVSFETIGKSEPIGICGSGLLDSIYELREKEYIDENGLLLDKYFEEGFKLYRDIRISQDDIRHFQMAKAAVRAGIEILLKEANLTYEDIDNLYIAGGFGSGIDVKKAAGVGLIPKELLAKSKAVGNSSIGGAIKLSHFAFENINKYTFDKENVNIEEIDRLISVANEIDLSRHNEFKEKYMEYMYI